MQAKSPLSAELKDRLKGLSTAASELSRFQVGLVVALVCLIAAGATVSYFRSRPSRVEVKDTDTSTDAARAGSSRRLTVHVAGAVVRPGLYKLAEGSRVSDAVESAGGASADASVDDLNLAQRVKDGQKVFVPRRSAPGQAERSDGAAGTPSSSGSQVNINTADSSELEKLPGVGPSLAQRIVDYREKNGPFSSIEDLDDVPGIGPGKLKSLDGLVNY